MIVRPTLIVLPDAPAKRASEWLEKPLTLLTQYLEGRHHTYARDTVLGISGAAEGLLVAHGRVVPELECLLKLLRAMEADLRPHLENEQVILFPHIRALEKATKARRRRPVASFGAMRSPVRAMIHDHDHLAARLRELHDATSGYASPEGAPPAIAVLYRELEALALSLGECLYLETHVLFPRALELDPT